MEAKLHENTLVEDVLSPIQYRVYPNTPYTEVVSLMVRRQLKSVPVVREDFEFLGEYLLSISFAQILLAALNFAISSKKSKWELKKNDNLGAKSSTFKPAFTQFST